MAAPVNEAAPLRFATADLAARDRIPMVREFLGRKLMRLEIEPLSDAAFQADLTLHLLPGLGIVSAANSPLRAARTRVLLADGDDNILLQIFTGAVTGAQRGREFAIGPGDAVVLSNGETGTLSIPSRCEILALSLPRETLKPLLRDIDSVMVRTVSKENAALRLLVQYLRIFREQTAMATPELQHAVASHLRDLVCLALGATREAAALAENRGLRAARLHAVKSDIFARLSHVDLSIREIARRQQISESYIGKLFRDENTSFSQFVLNHRLARAHRLLSDSRFANRRIGEIAFESGFGDLSYFNRSFRRRYGMTPSEARDEQSRSLHGS
jgi:AraC-like DNA-binding protein